MSEAPLDDGFELLRWTLEAGNRFFHVLYHEGVWMKKEVAASIVQDGYNLLVSRLHWYKSSYWK